MPARLEVSAQTHSKLRKHGGFSSWSWQGLLFLGIFHVLHISLFVYGWFSDTAGGPLPGLSKLKNSMRASRGATLPLSLDLMLLLLPMCRILTTQLRRLIKWIPLEESAWFHRQVAYNMLFYTVVHTASHYVNFYKIEEENLRPEKTMQIHYTQAAGITGHIMLFCMVIIYTFAHEKIRLQAFEAFQWGHRLSIIFLLASWTHGSGCFVRNTVETYFISDPKNYWAHCVGYQSWRWEIWISLIYMLERVYACYHYQRRANVSKVLQHPSNVIEIQFDKAGMDYKSGQWIFIKCPALSKSEWHPFSISSCPYDSYVSVHIRQAGDFTAALRDVFHTMIKPAFDMTDLDSNLHAASIMHARLQAREMPEIIVEGPYGPPAEDIFGNEVAVLIGAGVGVTPWASVLKSLWHLRDPKFAKVGHRLRRVEFIWTCRDLTAFEWFQNFITSLNDQSLAMKPSDNSIRLSCHTYITRLSGIILPAPKEDVNRSRSSSTAGSTTTNSQPVPLQDLFERADSSSRATQNSYIHMGRPDFKSIFQDIQEGETRRDNITAKGPSRAPYQVGVSFSGPKSMARDVRSACTEATTGDMKFKFKNESF